LVFKRTVTSHRSTNWWLVFLPFISTKQPPPLHPHHTPAIFLCPLPHVTISTIICLLNLLIIYSFSLFTNSTLYIYHVKNLLSHGNNLCLIRNINLCSCMQRIWYRLKKYSSSWCWQTSKFCHLIY
jgi:hypothetical protein